MLLHALDVFDFGRERCCESGNDRGLEQSFVVVREMVTGGFGVAWRGAVDGKPFCAEQSSGTTVLFRLLPLKFSAVVEVDANCVLSTGSLARTRVVKARGDRLTGDDMAVAETPRSMEACLGGEQRPAPSCRGGVLQRAFGSQWSAFEHCGTAFDFETPAVSPACESAVPRVILIASDDATQPLRTGLPTGSGGCGWYKEAKLVRWRLRGRSQIFPYCGFLYSAFEMQFSKRGVDKTKKAKKKNG